MLVARRHQSTVIRGQLSAATAQGQLRLDLVCQRSNPPSPKNAGRSADVTSMLGQRQRRWPSIDVTLGWFATSVRITLVHLPCRNMLLFAVEAFALLVLRYANKQKSRSFSDIFRILVSFSCLIDELLMHNASLYFLTTMTKTMDVAEI